MATFGFFDFDERCAQLREAGNPLVQLDEMIEFEAFRPILERVREKDRKNSSGRKPFDVVLMFKILILRTLYNLSDDQLEYQIRDRISFMQFLGLQLGDRVPDAKTIWLFRDELSKLDLVDRLFEQFDDDLIAAGFTARKGSIVDASIVEVPRQRNTRDENAQIKSGVMPASFTKNPCKQRQKDTDAQWLTKNKVRHFGYKNHVNVDVKCKLIRKYAVTDASVHDSQLIESLLDEKNTNAVQCDRHMVVVSQQRARIGGQLVLACTFKRSELGQIVVKQPGQPADAPQVEFAWIGMDMLVHGAAAARVAWNEPGR